ncbi:MAG: hypothetical protein U0136_04950 [Bdellovibrionota bacterium]
MKNSFLVGDVERNAKRHPGRRLVALDGAGISRMSGKRAQGSIRPPHRRISQMQRRLAYVQMTTVKGKIFRTIGKIFFVGYCSTTQRTTDKTLDGTVVP